MPPRSNDRNSAKHFASINKHLSVVVQLFDEGIMVASSEGKITHTAKITLANKHLIVAKKLLRESTHEKGLFFSLHTTQARQS